MSAATPLTVVPAVVTTGLAVTGLIGIPLAFIVIGVVLALFSVGYVAMARHVVQRGAFYAYISQGLSRPLGVGCSWIALMAYNALQVGLYGSSARPPSRCAEWFQSTSSGGSSPCRLVDSGDPRPAAGRRERQGARVLLITEVAVIVIFSLADSATRRAASVSFDTLAPATCSVRAPGRCWPSPCWASSASSPPWCSARRPGTGSAPLPIATYCRSR